MALKKKGDEGSADPKKRRRVGFASIDSGVEASECIKVFLVKNQDEVGAPSSTCIDPVDLNQFFGEDGKIYGYKNLKGGKGITDLKPALQNIFGESLLEKEEFLQTFSRECYYLRNITSNGTVICTDTFKEEGHASDTHLDAESPTVEIVRMKLHNEPAGLLYSRLVPLVLLLVDGGSPVDVTDPKWEIFLVVKKIPASSTNCIYQLLGFATVYRFYHYPDSSRLRISQILVLPPYQNQGHGRHLLEAVNSVASSENVYDITVEEPSEYLQYLRIFIDTLRLQSFEPTKLAVNTVISFLKEVNLSKRAQKSKMGPPSGLIEIARQKLKINKKQFLRSWEVLVYLNLDPQNPRCMQNFRTCIEDRIKGEILDKGAESNGKRLIEVPTEYDNDISFVMVWSQDGVEGDSLEGEVGGDRKAQEQQLNELVEKEMEDIAEIAKKVSSFCKSDEKQMGQC
ncbi:probable histone acetyltransferase type B catalytic subunit isoform X2 [Ananas comosus]|uniref:histone acetyltransferase n=1 Tax=Ananas comosus TaxID=4615 RepID=A0A6P5FTV0_ANACO|nr:probable histone acetyltransferase type B catalytic subunit isoform X2 [Ananas comosus]